MSSAKQKKDRSFDDEIERADSILRDLEEDSGVVHDSFDEYAEGFPPNTDISDAGLARARACRSPAMM